ncbi:rhodanese-like domain-containing protein [Tenacibaculum sp. C7A-26P2]|uniref:rhodanese-like domain-containing protein n=1 Tax=Tenacibaculum sp. C7A-26P2 TaxID=3447504 RepID=UPI003F863DAE
MNIKTSDLKTVLSTHSDIQLVDVRTPEEYAEGKINNAINIDVTSDNFEERVSNSLKKDSPVYLYCRSGGRSVIASKILINKGFEVYNLEGGYINWESKAN